MRAYVITGEIQEDGEDRTITVGVTSSKNLAIDLCENFMLDKMDDQLLNWIHKSKHNGCLVGGNYQLSYEMFFVNKAVDEMS